MKKLVSICFIFALGVFNHRAEESGTSASAEKANPLVWDATLKRQKLEGMGKLASFTFWVTNVSSSNASIFSTDTSCDCTVAELPSKPWLLKPGEFGALQARLNITGKFGVVTNHIGVMTSHGAQLLTVVVEIPLTPAPFNVSAREKDQAVARADRQAVFRNECAACHSAPAAGFHGETLFAKACGICHESSQRAAFVPDLAKVKTGGADYWRDWITHGKTNSLMPAFAEAEGGILDASQIESLVSLLVKKFPPADSAIPSRP